MGGYYPVNNEIDDLKILKEFEKKKNQDFITFNQR